MSKTVTQPEVTDLYFINDGSVFLVCPQTETARAWFAEHCPPGDAYTYLGEFLVTEYRYAKDLAEHAVNDGLTVS